MRTVKNACQKYQEKMELLVRPGYVQQPEVFTIEGRRGTYFEWGIELGVFIKKVGSGTYAQRTHNLKAYDEIIGMVCPIGSQSRRLLARILRIQ